ncbi:Mu transposase C-terminal domain-containing protein [Klebsiella oxytoca]|uniref:Mu transposase C-terminal domain-containing protein n=1 Tax=Klebsiella oxytoca TaxID=571 RepID=UPI003F7F45F9
MFVIARELIGVAGLPKTEKGIRQALVRYSAGVPELSRKRAGSKALEFNINCLPANVREVVKQRHYSASFKPTAIKKSELTPVKEAVKPSIKAAERVAVLRQCPALLESKASELTRKQREIADARMILVTEVFKLEESAGLSRVKAVTAISEMSRMEELPVHLAGIVETANARKGKRKGISPRTLNGWVIDYLRASDAAERLVLLAPDHYKAPPLEMISWLPLFLKHWRSLKGPTLESAYESFSGEWKNIYREEAAMLNAMPSIYAIRRALKKLPLRERLRGRVSGSAARALEIYQRRDWSQMPVNGCWISDGKSLDMKVAHPVHGQPFTPELTLVLDGRTRYLVGWSLSLSENQLAVADAYRHGIKHHGKPLFVYSDNGGGETNKMLDADITGIFPRLGITHMTGIPGNPQARGIIERLNAVIPRNIAQRFATYNGYGADREHVRMTGRRIESAVNAVNKGRELTPVQRNALRQLPSWAELLDAITQEVEKYNTQHRHSELPKRNGRHMTPAQYRAELLEMDGDEIEYLTEIELRDMFMPEQLRTAQRGYIQLINNTYYAPELINVDGEQVRVSFDIHDASRVYVRKIDGSFVCEAIWDGNLVAAVPVNAMQNATEQRRKRRINLNDKKRAEIEAEARPLLEAATIHPLSNFFADIPEPEKVTKEYHFLDAEFPTRYQNGG